MKKGGLFLFLAIVSFSYMIFTSEKSKEKKISLVQAMGPKSSLAKKQGAMKFANRAVASVPRGLKAPKGNRFKRIREIGKFRSTPWFKDMKKKFEASDNRISVGPSEYILLENAMGIPNHLVQPGDDILYKSGSMTIVQNLIGDRRESYGKVVFFNPNIIDPLEVFTGEYEVYLSGEVDAGAMGAKYGLGVKKYFKKLNVVFLTGEKYEMNYFTQVLEDVSKEAKVKEVKLSFYKNDIQLR